jgi:hypothetical protein
MLDQRKPRKPKGLSASIWMGLCGLACLSWVFVGVACHPSYQDETTFSEIEHSQFRPVIVLNNLVDLTARTHGQLFVEEVVFHAPTVQIRNGPAVVADLMDLESNGGGSIFFRYEASNLGQRGDAIGGTRSWPVDAFSSELRNEISFGFSPLERTSSQTEDSVLNDDYRLGRELANHTAFIRGYFSLQETETSETSYRSTHADGTKRTFSASGDPDGAPASGDPDGAPASGDPDGAPASGDPDGAPGDEEEDEQDDMEATAANNDSENVLKDETGMQWESQWIPFVLYLDSTFERSVSLQSLPLHQAKTGDVIPVELNINANNLFSNDLMVKLTNSARDITNTEEQCLNFVFHAETDNDLLSVNFNRPETAEESSIEQDADTDRLSVSGDRRPEEDSD